MSTYIYLQCLDHEPPLVADDESGQHLRDLDRIREDIRNRESLVAAVDEYGNTTVDDYFGKHSQKFLTVHKNCSIGIVDEDGVEYAVEKVAPDA